MAQKQEQAWETRRMHMVRDQIEARGVSDHRVLRAMRGVQREQFVPRDLRSYADADQALPIGHGQTISQPYVVAYMTELLEVARDHRVLEIGTGSGYQTAVLTWLADEVYSLELIPELARRAQATLTELGYTGAVVRAGDGYLGWPEHAPFDRILVTAAPPEVPPALLDQLARGGRLVLPVGPTPNSQSIVVVTKDSGGRIREKRRIGVRFVPMVHGRQDN